mmetsp:Transcript_21472/g.52428  ORF Transcript_21472/g.52428 Transcript_21472/m.52428 type:complete len:86 (+) Transcript_21472:145-402(+)|eukprot:CAMPEP_0198332824 /NCGR_PEP_ID=MMETSP1450-20131203/18535_1 /TAXON_ID=753684 ORGANISM="Madagascaria erythrocladiodes, Strain CCMP3234" /NCGR_SAMPLE_ID=MMETSP1450 /ASSEMBLY_ACC=CAM_ASM_001115 /LENGTH=85 /DNA_ID=CAMNT_0044037295 /DNA_START=126 /DNA_END=383 /DNA_ORIENTATION=+
MNMPGMPGAGGPSPVDMARAEMMFYSDLFTKMNDACFRKCVPRFNDGELNTGEMVCVDKCVAKYMEATNKVGEVLQKSQMLTQPQ